MKLKPVNDKIIIKPNKKNEEEVTKGGILLPDTIDTGKLMEAEVIAVSEGFYSSSGTLIPIICKVGDKILYNKNAQTHTYGNDIIMSANEILSIIEE